MYSSRGDARGLRCHSCAGGRKSVVSLCWRQVSPVMERAVLATLFDHGVVVMTKFLSL
jgi:hypothetical protein